MPNFVIIANGPFLPMSIIREAIEETTIIALDGAASRLVAHGVRPDVILGDFDSLPPPYKVLLGIDEKRVSESYRLDNGTWIVPAASQESTDLEKALQYCFANGGSQIDILCAVDGRMDHTWTNLCSLSKYYTADVPIFLHTDSQTMQYIQDSEVWLQGEAYESCAIFPFPKALLTSRGLVWNGDNLDLAFTRNASTSNQIQASPAAVAIVGQALVMHPPFMKAQKAYARLTRLQQLACLIEEEQKVENFL